MIKNKKLKINNKIRKMGKHDTNFTNSVFIMYWKMNEKKKKKKLRIFIDLMKENCVIKCKYEITYV